MKRLIFLILGLAALLANAATTDHPRLWLSNADLPRLRSWATASNPLFENGLKPLVERAKAEKARAAAGCSLARESARVKG